MFSRPSDINITQNIEQYTKNTVKKTIGWSAIQSKLPHSWLTSEGESVTIALICTGEVNHFDINPCSILEWKSEKSLYYVSPVNVKKAIDINGCSNEDGLATLDCGIICAQNSQTGMVGIAPRCQIQPISVGIDPNNIKDEDFARGLNKCLEVDVDIVISNITSDTFNEGVENQLKLLKEKNIPFLCCAGSFDESKISYPASSKYSLACGTFDSNNNLVNYKGNEVSSQSVTSTFTNNKYVAYSSLSISIPFMASILALLIAKNKKFIKICGESEFNTIDEMLQILKNSGFEDLKFGDRGQDHYGFIDPDEYLIKIQEEQRVEEEPQEEAKEEVEEEAEETDEETKTIKKTFKPLELIKKAFNFFRKK